MLCCVYVVMCDMLCVLYVLTVCKTGKGVRVCTGILTVLVKRAGTPAFQVCSVESLFSVTALLCFAFLPLQKCHCQ